MDVLSKIDTGAANHYAPVLHEISERRMEFRHIKFKFEHRKNNFEVHALAKAATSLAVGRHIWLGTLPDI
uniref:RNase H type-1 domain-containing protein n=1 Tax=Triticum urartu TaxID=4572 RepID=A0A8R7UL65_TRIUA